ncbi:MAG: hypothetical protein ACE5ID_03580, partial [Acidobacteriota bacterium]
MRQAALRLEGKPPSRSAHPGTVGRVEWLRKGLHISAGFLALLLRWLPPWGAWLLAAAALAGNAALLPRLTGHALEREDDRLSGVAWGILFYPLMVLFLTVVFFRRMEIAAAAWGVMAAGDGFATLLGKRFPSPRCPWNRRKSLAGSLAFLLAGGPAAWGLYLFVAAGAGRHPDPVAVLVQVGVATLLAAILESLPTGIDDNLTVPLAAAFLLLGLTAVDPAILAAREGKSEIGLAEF